MPYGPKPLIVDLDALDINTTAPWDCRDCKRSLPFTAYYEEKHCTYGRRKTCIECNNAKQRAYKGGIPNYHKHRNWKRNFNITPERFNELFEKQGSCCGSCGRLDPGGVRDWHIDHDHACCPENGRSCGKCIRGILCHRCNLMLGHALDDPERLRAGADYIERARGRNA